jgi:UDP-N-acetylglucosamine 2-epimerase
LRFNDIYLGEDFRFLPNKIAIMDQYAEIDMLREGFDKKALVITGNPHFDDLEAKARRFTDEEKWRVRQHVGLDTDVLFFYAANAWKKEKPKLGYWDLDNIKLVNDTLKRLPDQERKRCGLVVKLHPRVESEDLDEISTYINQESDDRIKLVTGISPQELILASDLTLTPFSTLGIETVYMGKPCISMQPGLKGEDYLAILTKNELIPVGYTPDHCRALVKKAFVDNEYREQELIKQASNFRTDGRATERVAGLVYQLLENR